MLAMMIRLRGVNAVLALAPGGGTIVTGQGGSFVILSLTAEP
jgi:hypothetical protein